MNSKHIATHSPLLRDNTRHSQWFDAELVALCRIDWYGQHFSRVYFLNLGHFAFKNYNSSGYSTPFLYVSKYFNRRLS